MKTACCTLPGRATLVTSIVLLWILLLTSSPASVLAEAPLPLNISVYQNPDPKPSGSTPIPPTSVDQPSAFELVVSGQVGYREAGNWYSVANVYMELYETHSHAPLASTNSDSNGVYSFPGIDISVSDRTLRVYVYAQNDRFQVVDILGATYDDNDSSIRVYPTDIFSTVNVNIEERYNDPFMIMRTLNMYAPAGGCANVKVEWPTLKGYGFTDSSSAFKCEIYLKGGTHADQKDPDVILHEFGHTKMWGDYGYWPCRSNPVYGLPPCYTGYHRYMQTNPIFAWGEGWPHFLAAMVQNDPVFANNGTGGYGWNLDSEPNSAWPKGADVEASVAGLLWDLFDPVSAGDKDTLDLSESAIMTVYADAEPGSTGDHVDTFYPEFWKSLIYAGGQTCQQLDPMFAYFGIPTDCNDSCLFIDFHNDAYIDIDDIYSVIYHSIFYSAPYDARYDVNPPPPDGQIDIEDIFTVASRFGETCTY